MLETIGQNLKLIDFGTAKFFYHQLVTPEAIISPGGYSPPEHYKLGYSPQGDIWSAGATLFYLLTGQHPLLVLGRYPRASQPADPRRFRPSISDRVAKVVMKSTQPEPSGRFLTANDMKQQLEGYAPKVYSNPIISLKNQEIPITTSRIVIGRSDDLDSLLVGETVTNSKLDIDSFGEKPAVEVAGDRMNIKVSDPGHYISRMHVEIFQKGQEWFLRDLGSLNGTGVLTETGWQSVHRAHRKEGAPHKLTGKDIISLGYNSVRGPYLVLTFLMD
jgi:serine/threonine protein kinase